jgi:DNA-binding SARP family transcriptional activator/TolB-like protein
VGEGDGKARLRLLGGFRLVTPTGVDATPRSVKGRAVLACVALAPDACLDRGRLAGLLWSESADAKASLRQAVREVRDALHEAGLGILLADHERVGLDLHAVEVDALEAERLARSADDADLERLADLLGGQLLEGMEVRDPEFHDWLVAERARREAAICRALEQALLRLTERRDAARLERIARALLAIEPAHEAAHRGLMRAHQFRGDVMAAIRQFEACRETLRRDFDLEASAETKALLQEIRTAAARREVARPPPVGPALIARDEPRASVLVAQRRLVAGDRVDEVLGAALTAGLRQALARNRWLAVVDRAPTPALKRATGTGAADPAYRVDVAMLRLKNRIRFAAELKTTHSMRLLWADRYDRGFGTNVFEVIDELAGSIARRLNAEIELAEIHRASRAPVEALSAYDCVLRAIPLIFRMTRESFAEAERLLRAAQEADPLEPFVYAWRAFWHFLYIGQGWADDPAAARSELDWVVRRAIELDPENSLALAVAGHVASFINHDYERALDLLDRSLRLDPHSAYAWDMSAVTLCYTGRAEEAIQRLDGSMHLWQHSASPYWFRTSACIALMLAGQHARAIEVGRLAIRENPHFQAAYRPLIAALGHAGQVEEAGRHLATLRRAEPNFSIDWFRASYPPLHGNYTQLYIEGLRKAGVPED